MNRKIVQFAGVILGSIVILFIACSSSLHLTNVWVAPSYNLGPMKSLLTMLAAKRGARQCADHKAVLMIRHNCGTFMSMLNALYVTRNDEGPEFEERVTAALRSAHLRRLPVAKAVAGVRPDTAPDLIVAGLGKHGTAVLQVKGLRRRFPGIAIVITGGKLSREISAQVYRAGATAVVPLGALGDAIANLAEVFQAGKPKDDRATRDRGRGISRQGHGSPRL